LTSTFSKVNGSLSSTQRVRGSSVPNLATTRRECHFRTVAAKLGQAQALPPATYSSVSPSHSLSGSQTWIFSLMSKPSQVGGRGEGEWGSVPVHGFPCQSV
jgi:hypothetical protein